jgi:hypothetical protein
MWLIVAEAPEHGALVTELDAALAGLPTCDRSAKIWGLAQRVIEAVNDGADVSADATRLLRLLDDSLQDDPWYCAYRAATRLSQALALKPAGV